MSDNTNNPLSLSQSWNNVAGSYAELADWVMTPFAKKALEFSRLNPSTKVLDVACGTGIVSTTIASQVQHIDALDFSEDMLKDLQTRLGKREIRNVELIHGDGQALPFKDESYDYAYSLFGLMFFPDREKGFSEMFRVLKKDGVAIVTSWASTEKSTLMQLTGELIAHAIPDAPSPRANSLTLENPDVFKKEMLEAGFKSVEILEVRADLPIITPRVFWRLMSEGGAPLALLKSKYSSLEWDGINQKILDYINTNFSEKNLSLHTTAYFGIGRK